MSNSADNTTESEASSDEVVDLTEEVPNDEKGDANSDVEVDEDAEGPGELRDTIQTADEEIDRADAAAAADGAPTPREPVDPPTDDEPIEPEPIDEVPAGRETVEEDSLDEEDLDEAGEDPVEESGDDDPAGLGAPDSVVDPQDDEPIEPEPIDEVPSGGSTDEADEAEEDDDSADPADAPPGEAYETVQMEAIDRSTIEREGQMRQLEQTLPLLSSRFAPEIVVASPRELVDDWHEGTSRIGEVSEPDETPASPPQTPAVDDDGSDGDQPPTETPTAPPSAMSPPDQPPPEEAQAEEPPETPADEGPPDETPVAGNPAASSPASESPATPPTPDDEADEKDEELSEIVDELVEGEDEADDEAAPPADEKGPRSDWIQQVFGELYLATVPESIGRRTEREADFIEDSLELDEDDNVLDLACGFGRHTIELVDRGYDVVGFDLSKPLLKKALQDAQQRSLDINFFHGDMRQLDFDGVFDACFCWQSSFGYFEDKTNLDVLARVNRALGPDGRVLLDVMNRDYVIRKMPHRMWWEGKDCIFLEEGEFDFDTSTLHMNRSFIYEDGRPPIEQDWYIRLYSPHELRQLFGNAGFQMTELSGAIHYRGDFIGRDSPKLIARAEKVKSLA